MCVCNRSRVLQIASRFRFEIQLARILEPFGLVLMSFLLSPCRWLCRIPWSSAPIAIWNDEGCALFCCSCQVRGLLLLHDPFWSLFVISVSNSQWWVWVVFGFVSGARYCTFLVMNLHSLQLDDLGEQLNAEEPNRMMHSSKYSSDFVLRCSRSLDLSSVLRWLFKLLSPVVGTIPSYVHMREKIPWRSVWSLPPLGLCGTTEFGEVS